MVFLSFIRMCNLQKRFIRVAFRVLMQAMFMNEWKQMAQRLKSQERLLTINKTNIIRWNIHRDNNFHSRRQVLSVSKNPGSSSLKLKFMFTCKAGFPMFAFFKDELEAKKSLKAFFYSQNYTEIFFGTISFYLRWKKSLYPFKVLYLSNLLLG